MIICNPTIIICKTYTAPNPTWLAQSTSQFKTRMNIIIKTWNMHTPDNPPPTAKRRQTCTYPATFNAIKTCSVHGHIWWLEIKCKDIIIIIDIKTGFYWNVWENKWVFNCDLHEEYVCVCGGWRKADYSRLHDPDRRKISGLSIFFLNRGIFSLRVSAVDRKVRDGVYICKRSARYWIRHWEWLKVLY